MTVIDITKRLKDKRDEEKLVKRLKEADEGPYIVVPTPWDENCAVHLIPIGLVENLVTGEVIISDCSLMRGLLLYYYNFAYGGYCMNEWKERWDKEKEEDEED